MNKIDLKISFLLALICFIAGFLSFEYIIQNLPLEQAQEILNDSSISTNLLPLVSAVQLFIISFTLSYLGLKLARKTNFSVRTFEFILKTKTIDIDKKSAIMSILSGIAIGFIIIGADRFYYQYQIPLIKQNKPQFSFSALITGILYGGVFEEVLLRLFFMSLLVWIFIQVFKINKDDISKTVYWAAIIATSVLFAVAHFPATKLFYNELTFILISRGLILNGIGGLVFGYLYWKKGLFYSMLAHMFAHIGMQLIFIPIFF